MREVLAVIRMNRINQTKQVLLDSGFPAFTAAKVMGRGNRAVDFEVRKALLDDDTPQPEALAALVQGPRLIAKRMLSMVVADEAVPSLVKALIGANQSGNPGDGKIFVLPIDDVLRVRTGEAGAKAIDEMTGR